MTHLFYTKNFKLYDPDVYPTLGGDPHYMVRIFGLEHPICFDFDSKKEEFYKLIDDPVHGKLIYAKFCSKI